MWIGKVLRNRDMFYREGRISVVLFGSRSKEDMMSESGISARGENQVGRSPGAWSCSDGK